MSRREFIKGAVRALFLGGLAGGMAWLAGRSRHSDACVSSNGVCRGCPALDKCGHPSARSYREAHK